VADFHDDLNRRRARERFESARRHAEAEDRRVNRNRVITFLVVLGCIVALCAWAGLR
jgi:hypothetical protein